MYPVASSSILHKLSTHAGAFAITLGNSVSLLIGSTPHKSRCDSEELRRKASEFPNQKVFVV
jgi:hypothetical protein